jgi:hypothetical protein
VKNADTEIGPVLQQGEPVVPIQGNEYNCSEDNE